MSSKSNSGNGVGFLGLLGIAFIVLKLVGVISWSWWYVTMPLWGGLVLYIVGFALFVIYKTLKEGK